MAKFKVKWVETVEYVAEFDMPFEDSDDPEFEQAAYEAAVGCHAKDVLEVATTDRQIVEATVSKSDVDMLPKVQAKHRLPEGDGWDD